MRKKTIHLMPIMLVCMSVFFVGCSHEEINPSINTENDIEQLYNELSSRPSVSIFLIDNISRGNNTLIPIFTPDDLKYLSSLSQKDFESFRSNIISEFGPNGNEIIENIEDRNYTSIFNLMNGHIGMDEYLNFATTYIESKSGIEILQELIPKNINGIQTKLYVAMAVYIDKLARPLLDELVLHEESSEPSRSGFAYCKWEAERRLALAGVQMGVDALCDVMTGGAALELTPLEGAAITADLTGIWLDYEVCNGRWH